MPNVQPNTLSPPEVLFHGRTCACHRYADGYVLMTTTAQVIGHLCWSSRAACWVFQPAPGLLWTSGTLADIGLWLRRLRRSRSPERGPA